MKTSATKECRGHIGFIAHIFREKVGKAEAYMNHPAYISWFSKSERLKFSQKEWAEAAEWARKMFSYAELIEFES